MIKNYSTTTEADVTGEALPTLRRVAPDRMCRRRALQRPEVPGCCTFDFLATSEVTPVTVVTWLETSHLRVRKVDTADARFARFWRVNFANSASTLLENRTFSAQLSHDCTLLWPVCPFSPVGELA